MAGVVSLIKDDHKQLEAVFKKLEGQDPDVAALLRQVRELLVPHSKAEETVVYPAIKSIVPAEEEDVDDGIEEHHHVEEMLSQLLASDPKAPGVDGMIAALIGEVRHHVEEEENEILPRLAKEASNDQLSQLGEAFTEAKERASAQMQGS